jgi:hypothetical protein
MTAGSHVLFVPYPQLPTRTQGSAQGVRSVLGYSV